MDGIIVITPQDAAAAAKTTATSAGASTQSATNTLNISDWVNLIGAYKELYLDPYTKVIQTHTEFMAEIADLMTIIAKATTAGNDSNHVNVDFDTIKDKIDAIRNKYDGQPLVTVKTVGEGGRAEAEAWAAELGLNPDNTVQVVDKTDDGQVIYGVVMDMMPLQQMVEALKDGNIDIPTYQAMQAAIDSEKAVLQNTVQVLAEKFSRANANFDSLIKVLSSLLAEWSQIMRAFLS